MLFRVNRRMASDRYHLSRYALYERYLQTELNDSRDFHKPDLRFLHGVYNYKRKHNLFDKELLEGLFEYMYLKSCEHN